jgi:hypothetical protein
MILAFSTVVKQNCIMVVDAEKFSLSELVAVRSGYPFRGAIEGGLSGVPVVQMKDIHPDTGVEWDGVLKVELTGRKEPEWLDAGDILFVPRGQRFFAARVGPPPGQAVCGPHLMQLRVRSGSGLVPEFLAWQINQPPIQKQLHAAAEGTNQLSIRVSEIECLNLALPPLKHQLQIVALAEAAARERQVLSRLVFNREQELAALAGDLAHAAGINQA